MANTNDAAHPFDDIIDLVEKLADLESPAKDSLADVFNALGRGLRPLGNLEQSLVMLAHIQGQDIPQLARPLIAVFAGTHGVASQLSDQDIVKTSKSRVSSLTQGEAAVRGMSAELGAAFKVYEMGIEYPSEDFTREPSLSERDCAAAIAFGMEVVAEGADVIILGNAGLGAATAAAGIAMSLYGGAANYWAGGLNAKTRIEAVEKAVGLYSGVSRQPLETLRVCGGRDIAGMVGAILAAGHQRIPILLDGYVSCAAAAVLHAINPGSIAHCFASHCSAEPAHDALLSRLQLAPILDLGINIGDGTGGAFALTILKAATAGLKTLKETNDV